MKNKMVRLVGHIVKEEVKRSFVNDPKNSTKQLVEKAYRKMAGKVADKVFNYSVQKVNESISRADSKRMVIGSEQELLSRNPQNLKLIILPKWELLNCDKNRVYRFNDVKASSRKWYLYDEKREIATLKQKRQNLFQKIFHRKQDRRDFIIKIEGRQEVTLFRTVHENGVRIGKIDFDGWYAREQKIYINDNCIASYEKVKSWINPRYVLDYSKEIDEVKMILVLFAMQIADEQKRLS